MIPRKETFIELVVLLEIKKLLLNIILKYGPKCLLKVNFGHKDPK